MINAKLPSELRKNTQELLETIYNTSTGETSLAIFFGHRDLSNMIAPL